MGWYFLIGLIYVLVNALIRKIDTDGDWLIALVWLLLWPFCFIALITALIQDLIYKNKV